MLSFVARRAVLLGAVLWAMTVFVFVVSQAIPADPARVAAGQDASAEMVAQVRREFGLDQPLAVQYARFFKRLLGGDLGQSIMNRRPVLDELRERFPATLELTFVSMLLGVGVGVPLGVWSAARPGRSVDHVSRLAALAGVSIPVFWYGLVLQVVFYRWLDWFPAGGRSSETIPYRITGFYALDSLLTGNPARFGDALSHLALPAFALSLLTVAIVARTARTSMLEVLREDYVRTARSKGLSAWTVTWRHALRNAMIPIVTVISLRVGTLIGGAVLTEAVFGWPGLGGYAFDAIENLDFPVIFGVTLAVCAAYALLNFLTDLAYLVLDPRIRATM